MLLTFQNGHNVCFIHNFNSTFMSCNLGMLANLDVVNKFITHLFCKCWEIYVLRLAFGAKILN